MLVLHFKKLQSAVSDGVQMRRSFISSLVAVEISHDWSVDHQPLVRVDTDAEQTRVSVDLQHLIPSTKIVQNTSLVKNGQVGHVFFLFKLGRIALKHFGLRKRHRASFAGFQVDFVSIVFDNFRPDEDIGRIRNPTIHL